MRHSTLLFVICVLMGLFCGCSSQTKFCSDDTPSFASPSQACDTFGFFIDNGILYFSADGFYNMGLFAADANGTCKLWDSYELPEGNPTGQLYVYDDKVYFTVQSEETYIFYVGDTKGLDCQELHRGTGFINTWLIRNDILYFTNCTSPNSAVAFYGLDLKNKQIKLISEHILWFGATEDTVYYVTGMITYKLWKYRSQDTPLLVCDKLSVEDGSEPHIFSITDLYFVYQSSSSKKCITVFDLTTCCFSNYLMPLDVQQYTAYKDYAFITLYDEQLKVSDPAPSAKNGLYRLSLKSGETELWSSRFVELKSLVAVDENCLFFTHLQERALFTKTEVYQIKAADKDPLLLYRY